MLNGPASAGPPFYIQMRNLFFVLAFFFVTFCSAQEQEIGIYTNSADTVKFGTCVKGDTVEAIFYFRIEGKGKLLIRQVHPGCQCTVPLFPSDSMAAGYEDSIVLQLHSRNLHSGPVEKYAIVINTGEERVFWIKGTILDLDSSNNKKNRKLRMVNRAR